MTLVKKNVWEGRLPKPLGLGLQLPQSSAGAVGQSCMRHSEQTASACATGAEAGAGRGASVTGLSDREGTSEGDKGDALQQPEMGEVT